MQEVPIPVSTRKGDAKKKKKSPSHDFILKKKRLTRLVLWASMKVHTRESLGLRMHVRVLVCVRLRVCACVCASRVHGDVCVRVWRLHDSQCHNCEQKGLDILSGNHSDRSCVSLQHPNLTLSTRVTWLDPHLGSERGSPTRPSCPPSRSLLCRFTWNALVGPPQRVWESYGCKTREEEPAEAGNGLLPRVKCLVSWLLATQREREREWGGQCLSLLWKQNVVIWMSNGKG